MKTLYFDCFAGASGNMILAALVELGADEKELRTQLSRLNVAGFAINFSRMNKSGIDALHAEVVVPDEKAHRHLHQIEKIIDESDLSDSVKTRSLAVFGRLAAAEAKVHGIAVEKVHFHEVGALDAIVDIVGACIAFELLGVERFLASPMHVGSGFVNMAHGKFPVPPPAVAEILANAPIYSTEIKGELVTPTGAAIIATVCESFGPMPEMTIAKTAYGAGTREYEDFPNALRVILGETSVAESNGQSKLLLLESNLDDVSGETLGYFLEKVFANGALDCWFTPIQMKKNRPATLVSILCKPIDRQKFFELFVRETPTLGVRVSEVDRLCLDRKKSVVETRFGEVAVKIARLDGEIVNIKPEFDQVREIALRENLPLREVEAEIEKSINW